MKKIKYLVVLLIALMVIPFGVMADEEPVEAVEENVSKAVMVYFFRGDGCSYCAAAEEWFNEIALQDLGKKFIVKDYETWYNEENAELMQNIADLRNEKADGVPYIIIGDQSWTGFADEYKEEIISKIEKVHEEDVNERYDVMKLVNSGRVDKKEVAKKNDALSLFIIVVATVAIGFGIYIAKKSVTE